MTTAFTGIYTSPEYDELLEPEVPGPAPVEGPLRCSEPGCDYAAQPGARQAAALARHRTRSHPDEPRGYAAPPRDEPDDEAPADPLSATEDPGPPEPRETAPRPAPSRRFWQGWRDRIRKPSEERAAGSGTPRTPARARPKAAGKRMSIAPDISDLYADLGRRLEYTPYYPVGRILTYQGPAAGVIWDDTVANTALDRFLVQPACRHKDKAEAVMFLAAPPILMFTIQNAQIARAQAIQEGNDAEARRLEGWIRAEFGSLGWVLRRSMLKLAPAVAEARERLEREDQIIREAFPQLDPAHDPVEALISSLFEPPGQPEQEDPGEQ